MFSWLTAKAVLVVLKKGVLWARANIVPLLILGSIVALGLCVWWLQHDRQELIKREVVWQRSVELAEKERDAAIASAHAWRDISQAQTKAVNEFKAAADDYAAALEDLLTVVQRDADARPPAPVAETIAAAGDDPRQAIADVGALLAGVQRPE